MTAAPLGAARDDRPLRLLPDDAVSEPGTNGGPVTIALVALEGKRTDDLLAAAVLRQDDLRDAEIRRHDDLLKAEFRHRSELDRAESRRLDALAGFERSRVDAVIASDRAAVLLANTEARLTAVALADRVETAAKTLATAAGSKEQASEGRERNQWTFERALTVLGLAAGAIYFLLNSGAVK
jgi:hypothetical protein